MNSYSGESIRIRRALISAWRKEPAVELARGLAQMGVSLIGSGGTAAAIAEAGIDIEPMSVQTGFDDLLDGRIKTLHPAVYAAILSRRDSDRDLDDLSKFNIDPIDLVAVDLYPFPDKPAHRNEAVELIDIGGVSLIRAAAKNFQFVTVLSRAEQFTEFIDSFRRSEGNVSLETRLELAIEAFKWTSTYDKRIASGLGIK